MLEFQRCITTTHKETVLSGSVVSQKRSQLTNALSSYTREQAYERLLKEPAKVELVWNHADFCIPMKRSIFGLYLVKAMVEGHACRFVIDTGAQISSIRTSLLPTLQLRSLPGTMSIGSVGGKEEQMSGYLVKELKLGELMIRNLPIVGLATEALQLKFKDVDLAPFDGILGWDILSQLDFELDDVGKQLKILKNVYRLPYPNMVKAMFPIFLVKDDQGNLMTLGFDSGARYSWMQEQAMRAYGYTLGEEAGVMGFGVHGLEQMSVKLITQMDLYLYKAKLSLRHVHTGRTNIFPNVSLDGILGNEIFRNRRIRIINSKQMVLLA